MHLSLIDIKKAGLAFVASAALLVSACTPQPDDMNNGLDPDPLEGLNRAIFEFNHALDTYALRPVVVGYQFIMPERGRVMVSNAVNNIYEPVVFANSVLQLDPQNSFTTLWRFLLNSTVGVAGLFDVASDVGLKNRKTDLGQTFALYGAGEGPYLVLPILGPSNGRDALGRVGDLFLNPITYADDWITYTVFGVTIVDKRSNNLKVIDDLYSSSLDPYTTFRSAYQQHRRADNSAAKAAREKAWKQAGTCTEQHPLGVPAKKTVKKSAKKKPAATPAAAPAPMR